MGDYPEHEKMSVVTDKSQAIGEFLEWLDQDGWQRMRWGVMTDQVACTYFNCVDGYVYGDRDRPCRVCAGQGYVEREVHGWIRDHRTTSAVLAEYFEIDRDKIEAEKQAMLDAFRASR